MKSLRNQECILIINQTHCLCCLLEELTIENKNLYRNQESGVSVYYVDLEIKIPVCNLYIHYKLTTNSIQDRKESLLYFVEKRKTGIS